MTKKKIAASFSNSANTYDACADMHEQIMQKLISKLNKDYSFILDIGCGTGTLVKMLSAKYPKAKIIGLDLAKNMLEVANNKILHDNVRFLVGDGESLPFSHNQFDLVISSSSLQWMDPSKVFFQVSRVLKFDGDFFFTTFGPNTLGELKAKGLSVNEFPSLSELEKSLLMNFVNVKLDSEIIAKEFNNVRELFSYLRSIGAQVPTKKLSKGLMTKTKLDKLFPPDQPIKVSFEVIYGQASGDKIKEKKGPVKAHKE